MPSLTARSFARASNEFFTRADSATTSTGDIDFFVCAWVRQTSLPAAANYHYILSKNTNFSAIEYRFYSDGDNSGQWTFDCFAAGVSLIGAVRWPTAPVIDTWYFVLAYHDATNNLVGISVNGGNFVTSATTGVISDTAANFQIGKDGNSAGSCMNGRIACAGLGKTLPTQAQVSQLYNYGEPMLYAEMPYSLQQLFASGDFWNLNEASGNAVASVNAQTLTDTNTVTSAAGIAGGLGFGQLAAVSNTFNDRLSPLVSVTNQPLIWPGPSAAVTNQPAVWPSPLAAVTNQVRYPPYPPPGGPPDPPKPPKPPKGPPRPIGPPWRLSFFRRNEQPWIFLPEPYEFDDMLMPGGLGTSSPGGGINPPVGLMSRPSVLAMMGCEWGRTGTQPDPTPAALDPGVYYHVGEWDAAPTENRGWVLTTNLTDGSAGDTSTRETSTGDHITILVVGESEEVLESLAWTVRYLGLATMTPTYWDGVSSYDPFTVGIESNPGLHASYTDDDGNTAITDAPGTTIRRYVFDVSDTTGDSFASVSDLRETVAAGVDLLTGLVLAAAEDSDLEVDLTGTNTMAPDSALISAAGIVGTAAAIDPEAEVPDGSYERSAITFNANDPLTIEMWGKISFQVFESKSDEIGETGYDINFGILDNENGTGTPFFYRVFSIEDVYSEVYAEGDPVANVDWTQILLECDPDDEEFRVYVNNTLVIQESKVLPWTVDYALTPAQRLRLLNAGATANLWRMWDRLLTSDERAYLYNSGAGRAYGAL